jgi:hypothetical protein
MSSGFGRIGGYRRCYDGVTVARVTDMHRLSMNVRPDPAGSRAALIAPLIAAPSLGSSPRHRHARRRDTALAGAAIPQHRPRPPRSRNTAPPAADMSVAHEIRLNHA